MAITPVTALSYQGSMSRNTCGYCNNNGGCSFYVRAETLTNEHYQLLLDRGWRRSGTLLYKPHMKLTCCPQYTIRLNTLKFKPSRDQRQCLHRWTRHVLGEEYIREATKKYPRTKKEKKKEKNGFDLASSVHAPLYSMLKDRIPPEPAHKFEVTLESSNFTQEKYELFKNYQQTVHKEHPSAVSPEGFKRFLCKTPLPEIVTSTGKKLGSYHQCYRLDGRLIAMGVLDLLPHCVSGVYFIYHEDYAKWHLGKISACREAVLALEGGYEYYYMGYYIHSCQKMRYKGEYAPSELLDPESGDWNILDDNLRKELDKNKYFSRAPTPTRPATNEDDEEEEDNLCDPGFIFKSRMPGIMTKEDVDRFDIGKVKVRLGGDIYRVNDLRGVDKPGPRRSLFEETVAAVGPQVAQEMVMVF